MRLFEMVEELGLERALYFLGLPKRYEIDVIKNSERLIKVYVKHNNKVVYLCCDRYDIDYRDFGSSFFIQIINDGEIVRGSFTSFMKDENRADPEFSDDSFDTIKSYVMLKVIKGYLG